MNKKRSNSFTAAGINQQLQLRLLESTKLASSINGRSAPVKHHSGDASPWSSSQPAALSTTLEKIVRVAPQSKTPSNNCSQSPRTKQYSSSQPTEMSSPQSSTLHQQRQQQQQGTRTSFFHSPARAHPYHYLVSENEDSSDDTPSPTSTSTTNTRPVQQQQQQIPKLFNTDNGSNANFTSSSPPTGGQFDQQHNPSRGRPSSPTLSDDDTILQSPYKSFKMSSADTPTKRSLNAYAKLIPLNNPQSADHLICKKNYSIGGKKINDLEIVDKHRKTYAVIAYHKPGVMSIEALSSTSTKVNNMVINHLTLLKSGDHISIKGNSFYFQCMFALSCSIYQRHV
ncbi:hypothetical protein SAMD00019534_014760 [Acytostelium subglobosum LB1]|uniref:hypothetical protein n=1 Tax=Acytostelium subglobosum LB1 TaxID=1410327 RepID=UPI000644FCA1|nr:hypothetical protein SAMD00019534_014760 [Acytostelium subglobosum LB1]GAM18301.1 hypothetical protein SAMD00019534_014760 [Acytostelium subglobosum LB1]|eukprot:XP_012757521.1 hypothetical protein SAMD00019534_014760 [Acytostelium subglobosum LB1]